MELVRPASRKRRLMSDHAREDGLEVTLRIADLEVVCFVPYGNARNSHVLWLMSTDSLNSQAVFRGKNFRDSLVLCLMLIDDEKLWSVTEALGIRVF